MGGKVKYRNQGNWDKELLNYFCKLYLEIEFQDEMSRDPDFLDYIWEMLMYWCSSKQVYEYLIKCREQRDQQEGKYQPFQADCLLETFTDIYRLRITRPYSQRRRTRKKRY